MGYINKISSLRFDSSFETDYEVLSTSAFLDAKKYPVGTIIISTNVVGAGLYYRNGNQGVYDDYTYAAIGGDFLPLSGGTMDEGAVIEMTQGLAIGNGASAENQDSIAIGKDAVTDSDNQVKITTGNLNAESSGQVSIQGNTVLIQDEAGTGGGVIIRSQGIGGTLTIEVEGNTLLYGTANTGALGTTTTFIEADSSSNVIRTSELPTSSAGLPSGALFTQTATELGGAGTTKVICIV